MAEGKNIILIHESVKQSIVRDAVSILMFVGVSLAARATGSTALELVALICVLIIIAGKSSRMMNNSEKTPDEARAWLDESFPKGGE